MTHTTTVWVEVPSTNETYSFEDVNNAYLFQQDLLNAGIEAHLFRTVEDKDTE